MKPHNLELLFKDDMTTREEPLSERHFARLQALVDLSQIERAGDAASRAALMEVTKNQLSLALPETAGRMSVEQGIELVRKKVWPRLR